MTGVSELNLLEASLGSQNAPPTRRATPVPPGPSEPRLSRLDASAPSTSIDEVIAELALEARARDPDSPRPHVALNMVTSLDGHAAVQARSGGLSSPADRALFHGLRSITDAVLVGAGTARGERYGRLIRDPHVRTRREQAGRSAEPLACVVSGRRLTLPPQLPLLNEPDARVVMLTPSAASLPPTAASVQYVRTTTADGRLDLDAALRELRAGWDVREILCEGGPALNAQLLSDRLVDELFLTVSPVLAGGEDPLTIVAPRGGLDPTTLTFTAAFTSGSFLFLRYRVNHDDPLT